MIIEVYEVDEGADNDYAKGKLKYMEQENFDGDKLMNKSIYNEDQSLRGKEVYDYNADSKNPIGSKYYDQQGALLSTYKYTFKDSLKVESKGFEGDTDALLRIERFLYDDKGNMVRKSIYDASEIIQRSFLFGHDAYGNEVKMVLLDGNDEEVLSESYEIVTRAETGEWIEKWGYVNDNSAPSTFYHKRKSDL